MLCSCISACIDDRLDLGEGDRWWTGSWPLIWRVSENFTVGDDGSRSDERRDDEGGGTGELVRYVIFSLSCCWRWSIPFDLGCCSLMMVGIGESLEVELFARCVFGSADVPLDRISVLGERDRTSAANDDRLFNFFSLSRGCWCMNATICWRWSRLEFCSTAELNFGCSTVFNGDWRCSFTVADWRCWGKGGATGAGLEPRESF